MKRWLAKVLCGVLLICVLSIWIVQSVFAGGFDNCALTDGTIVCTGTTDQCGGADIQSCSLVTDFSTGGTLYLDTSTGAETVVTVPGGYSAADIEAYIASKNTETGGSFGESENTSGAIQPGETGYKTVDSAGITQYSGFYYTDGGGTFNCAVDNCYRPISTGSSGGGLAQVRDRSLGTYNCPAEYYPNFESNYTTGCHGAWGNGYNGNMVYNWPPNSWSWCPCDPEDIGCSGTPYILASECLPRCSNGTIYTTTYSDWGRMGQAECYGMRGGYWNGICYYNRYGELTSCNCMVPSGYTCEQCGTDPQAPTLVSPENGSTLEQASTTLTWNKVTAANWGLASGSCGSVLDSKYNIYIGYSPSSLYYLTSKMHTSIAQNGATESFTFTNNSTQRIYWKIEAESASGRKTSSETWNFIKASREAWWQAVGAGIYAGSTAGGTVVQSKAPAGEYLIEPGVGGAIGALMRSSGVANVGSGTVSTTGYSTRASYKGKKTDYQYFAAGMGVTPNTTNAWGADTMNKPANNPSKDFYFINPSGSAASVSSPWSVLAGESYVVFVDGNLTIASDVTVADGGFLAFIVSGDITVDPSVTSMQGLYLADGNFVTSSNGGTDVALAVQGSVVAWGGVDLNRDMKAGNTNPGEQFTYRPDLIENMPDKMKVFGLEWKEVAPGTFN